MTSGNDGQDHEGATQPPRRRGPELPAISPDAKSEGAVVRARGRSAAKRRPDGGTLWGAVV